MNEQLLHLLGLARRAGKLALGSEAAMESIRRHKAAVVFTASDLSGHTASDFSRAAAREKIRIAALRETMDEINVAVGRRSGVIAVNDTGFANKLLALNAED